MILIFVNMIINNTFLHLTFDFENINAANDAAIICSIVEVSATNRLLNMYLDIGTRSLFSNDGNAK